MTRVFVSAAHKSSGKTTLSIGLCAAFCARDLIVQPFKKGPDYIDPLWLSAASGNACYNLDFNTMTTEEIISAFSRYGQSADLSVIEANKGLYDGMALDGSDSNAALAKLIAAPVILVIDTRGMTRGVAPLLLGYQAFDPQINISGVILNRTGGERHAAKLRSAVEEYTDIKVLGAVGNHREMEIEERHLGLMPSNESDEAAEQIARIGQQVAEQVDLQAVLSLADVGEHESRDSAPLNSRTVAPGRSLRIGICQDAAFAFYYPDDLEALQQAGAELVSINTVTDNSLPDIDGLFIGGGFPEARMHELAANKSMRSAIREAIEDGLPVYAECGGLMYLSRSLSWKGEQAEMVGIIPGDAVMHDKPQGRGYVKLQETGDMPWLQGKGARVINAHEFHYSGLENLTDQGKFAYRILSGTGIDGEYDGWVYKNLLASYTHMRNTGQFPWAQRFVTFIRSHQRKFIS